MGMKNMNTANTEDLILKFSDENRKHHKGYFNLIQNIIDQEKDVFARAEMINEVNAKLLWTVQSIKGLATNLSYPIGSKVEVSND